MFLWFAKFCLPRLSTSENGDHRFTPFNTSRNWYAECVRILNSCDQRDRCAWCLAMGEDLMRKSRVTILKDSHIKLPNLPQATRSVKHTSGATGSLQNINRIVIKKIRGHFIERYTSSSKVIYSELRDISSRFHFILSVEKFRRFVGEVLVAETIGSFALQNDNENHESRLRCRIASTPYSASDEQPTPLAQISDRKYLRDWIEEWFKASAWGKHFKGHKYQQLKCSICAKDMPAANCWYNGNLGEKVPGRWVVAHFFECHPQVLKLNTKDDGSQ
ncbi:hypothetical protein TWF788_004308 [Orbilia oligospora]|uniref:Uncharacterized protein n=1 Tax=Orbilia oligospora TaxID=2813651 RepID=A0A7C8Q4P6_ORBOL|nr:hypothetical protein TWF788_004308 [Orbilia oligospora]